MHKFPIPARLARARRVNGYINTNQITAHPSASWKLRAISVLLLGSVHTIRVSEENVSLGDTNVYVGGIYLVASGTHLLCIS